MALHGGIAGISNNSKIFNSYNLGRSYAYSGCGIIGASSTTNNIYNCYNVGAFYRAGIAATDGTIDNCYNIGDTIYTQNFGYGIYEDSPTITNCFSKQGGTNGGTKITDYATLLTSLNTYVTENSSTSTVELSTWKIGANGYPVFDWQ